MIVLCVLYRGCSTTLHSANKLALIGPAFTDNDHEGKLVVLQLKLKHWLCGASRRKRAGKIAQLIPYPHCPVASLHQWYMHHVTPSGEVLPAGGSCRKFFKICTSAKAWPFVRLCKTAPVNQHDLVRRCVQRTNDCGQRRVYVCIGLLSVGTPRSLQASNSCC